MNSAFTEEYFASMIMTRKTFQVFLYILSVCITFSIFVIKYQDVWIIV